MIENLLILEENFIEYIIRVRDQYLGLKILINGMLFAEGDAKSKLL